MQEGWRAVFLSQKLRTTTSQFHTHQNYWPSIHETGVGPPLSNDLWSKGGTQPVDTQERQDHLMCSGGCEDKFYCHELANFNKVIGKESQLQIFQEDHNVFPIKH